MAAFILSVSTGIIPPSQSHQPNHSSAKSFLGYRLSKCKRASLVRLQVQEHIEGQNALRMAGDSPPVNLPSGVLLLSSSVLAIASIGCIFELSGGNPKYGAATTEAILALALPGFLFLFYSAIRKGQQEAMEDP